MSWLVVLAAGISLPALEADLRKQMQRVALLERRKLEQEAEQQTIGAYYQARLAQRAWEDGDIGPQRGGWWLGS